jgi:hypothetical protein
VDHLELSKEKEYELVKLTERNKMLVAMRLAEYETVSRPEQAELALLSILASKILSSPTFTVY